MSIGRSPGHVGSTTALRSRAAAPPAPRREAPARGASRGDAATVRDRSVRLAPLVVLGPYRLAVEWRVADAMLDPRARACIDPRAGRIELRQDLTGLALAEAFFGCLVQLAHARRIGRGAPLHESPAHRLATGLVEFALRSPGVWLWFNLLLSRHLPGEPQFDRAVRGVLPTPPALPGSIVIAGTEWRVRLDPAMASEGAVADGAPGDAGGGSVSCRELRLDPRLAGTALPVAAVDAITQAMHDVHGLGPGAAPSRLRRVECRGWLGVMRHSPAAWRWLLWSIGAPQRAVPSLHRH